MSLPVERIATWSVLSFREVVEGESYATPCALVASISVRHVRATRERTSERTFVRARWNGSKQVSERARACEGESLLLTGTHCQLHPSRALARSSTFRTTSSAALLAATSLGRAIPCQRTSKARTLPRRDFGISHRWSNRSCILRERGINSAAANPGIGRESSRRELHARASEDSLPRLDVRGVVARCLNVSASRWRKFHKTTQIFLDRYFKRMHLKPWLYSKWEQKLTSDTSLV